MLVIHVMVMLIGAVAAAFASLIVANIALYLKLRASVPQGAPAAQQMDGPPGHGPENDDG